MEAEPVLEGMLKPLCWVGLAGLVKVANFMGLANGEEQVVAMEGTFMVLLIFMVGLGLGGRASESCIQLIWSGLEPWGLFKEMTGLTGQVIVASTVAAAV